MSRKCPPLQRLGRSAVSGELDVCLCVSSPCGFVERDRMKGENEILKTEYVRNGENQSIVPRS